MKATVPTRRGAFAPPLAGELSAKRTEGALSARAAAHDTPPPSPSATPPPQAGEVSARSDGRPSTTKIWSWLAEVPDPEIPTISIVDLGIVRGVTWEGAELVIEVTPTYSGCPATAVIAFDIVEALRRRGIYRVRTKTRLSPAWTTDWISEEGREKLKAAGIAPPLDGARCAAELLSPVVECPHCGSLATEQVSRFGSTPCKAQWRCRECLEPFDWFKNF